MAEHKQDKNAFAYVIYERGRTQDESGPEWIRSRMFYAAEEGYDRDEMWDREVTRRDPRSIRVEALYDESANDARREANLDAINAQYDADSNPGRRASDNRSLADAVEWALEIAPPHLDEFEGLIKTLEAFESMVQQQLQVPPHTITRQDWLPSVEQLAAIEELTDG